MPEEKLRPIFDVPQWRLLSRQFAQARGMEQWLISNGVLPDKPREAGQRGIPIRGSAPARLLAPATKKVDARDHAH